jgi:hypothetical protein
MRNSSAIALGAAFRSCRLRRTGALRALRKLAATRPLWARAGFDLEIYAFRIFDAAFRA